MSVIFQHLNAPVFYLQPHDHGHGETKKTGFALHNLEPLKPTNKVAGREQRIWKMPPSATRKRDRSQTFPGVAQAVVQGKNKYPSGFRVLCWNCNSSLGLYGYSPANRDFK